MTTDEHDTIAYQLQGNEATAGKVMKVNLNNLDDPTYNKWYKHDGFWAIDDKKG